MKRLNDLRMRLVLIGIVTVIVLSGGSVRADFTFGEAANLKSIIPVIDPAHESIACFSYDGLEIYILSDRPGGFGDFDLWVLKRNSVDEVWGEPENLGPAINSAQSEGNVSISADGLTLYLDSDRPGGYGFEDIYMATRATKDTPWEPAVNMGSKINSSTTEANPHITADGLELYFQSGRFGDADIYVARRATANDPWSDQVNLGPPVSSAYLDNDPVPSADGRLLMFSDFHKCPPFRPGGYGGSDIWMSKSDSLSGSWQEPINLGPNVNTAGHELIPCFSSDGRALHFTSLRVGTWDNWQVSILPVVDFNGDRIVDAEDMCIMVDHWGEDYPLCDIGPMPWGDGIVDIQDLIVIAEHLFEEFPPAQ